MGRLKFDSTQVTALRTRLGLEALSGERRALVEDGDLFRGHRRGSCARAEGVSALFLKRKTRPTRFFCNPLSDRIVSLLYGYSSVVYRLEPNFLSGRLTTKN